MSDALRGRLIEAVAGDIPYVCDRIWKDLEPLCESPIEIALGAAMALSLQMSLGNTGDFRLCSQNDEAKLAEFFLLMPQYQWMNYRIDWALKLPCRYLQPYVFVECDGHDFHERTPDQAARDRSRDRVIQEANIPILRYTGREIYRDLAGCTRQVFDMCCAVADRQK